MFFIPGNTKKIKSIYSYLIRNRLQVVDVAVLQSGLESAGEAATVNLLCFYEYGGLFKLKDSDEG